MTGAILNLLVNVIIVVLLVVTIGYCWVLNRRIRVLQDSKGELAQLLKHFDNSTQRASESIVALQTASKKIGENIQTRAEKAHFLLDDLTYMIDKAQAVSSQMEADIAISRARHRVVSEDPPPPPPPLPLPSLVEEEYPEDDVWQQDTDEPVLTKKAPASRERTVAALEAVLERAKRRSQDVPSPVPTRKTTRRMPPPPASRSKSEKELLEMIRSGFSG